MKKMGKIEKKSLFILAGILASTGADARIAKKFLKSFKNYVIAYGQKEKTDYVMKVTNGGGLVNVILKSNGWIIEERNLDNSVRIFFDRKYDGKVDRIIFLNGNFTEEDLEMLRRVGMIGIGRNLIDVLEKPITGSDYDIHKKEIFCSRYCPEWNEKTIKKDSKTGEYLVKDLQRLYEKAFTTVYNKLK